MNNGNNSKAGTSIGSLIVGAAIGAAAVTMLHEPTRKKLKDKIKNALDKSETKMDEIKDKANNVKKSLTDKAGEVKKDLKNKAIKELGKTQKKIAATI